MTLKVWSYSFTDFHILKRCLRWHTFTTLDLYVFTKLTTTTIFHVQSWELTKCKLFLTCKLLLPQRFPSGPTIINRPRCYNCYYLHVHHNISRTKIWGIKYYIIYLYMVFVQHCVPFRTTLFSLNRKFSVLFSCVKLWYKQFKLIESSPQLNLIKS